MITHKELMMFMKKSNKKREMSIIFDDMIDDKNAKKHLKPIVTELFMKGRKPNILIVSILQSYFSVPKIVSLNETHIIRNNLLKNECS